MSRSYDLYKLTRDFGEDYQRAERRLQGQRARLDILSETKKESVVAIPENGTDLGAIVVSTLQGVETGFEKCEAGNDAEIWRLVLSGCTK